MYFFGNKVRFLLNQKYPIKVYACISTSLETEDCTNKIIHTSDGLEITIYCCNINNCNKP